ncbi:MAG: hypothetical protein ACI88C_002538 [Acidimicrobiales bacterium]
MGARCWCVPRRTWRRLGWSGTRQLDFVSVPAGGTGHRARCDPGAACLQRQGQAASCMVEVEVEVEVKRQAASCMVEVEVKRQAASCMVKRQGRGRGQAARPRSRSSGKLHGRGQPATCKLQPASCKLHVHRRGACSSGKRQGQAPVLSEIVFWRIYRGRFTPIFGPCEAWCKASYLDLAEDMQSPGLVFRCPCKKGFRVVVVVAAAVTPSYTNPHHEGTES